MSPSFSTSQFFICQFCWKNQRKTALVFSVRLRYLPVALDTKIDYFFRSQAETRVCLICLLLIASRITTSGNRVSSQIFSFLLFSVNKCCLSSFGLLSTQRKMNEQEANRARDRQTLAQIKQKSTILRAAEFRRQSPLLDDNSFIFGRIFVEPWCECTTHQAVRSLWIYTARRMRVGKAQTLQMGVDWQKIACPQFRHHFILLSKKSFFDVSMKC